MRYWWLVPAAALVGLPLFWWLKDVSLVNAVMALGVLCGVVFFIWSWLAGALRPTAPLRMSRDEDDWDERRAA